MNDSVTQYLYPCELILLLQVFGCLPSDEVKSFAELPSYNVSLFVCLLVYLFIYMFVLFVNPD